MLVGLIVLYLDIIRLKRLRYFMLLRNFAPNCVQLRLERCDDDDGRDKEDHDIEERNHSRKCVTFFTIIIIV